MEVLQGDEEEEQFRDLRDEVDDKWRHSFIIERMGHSKEAASVITPEPIKKLRPPLAAVLLVWQISWFAFEAYYPLAGVEPEKKLQKREESNKKKNPYFNVSFIQNKAHAVPSLVALCEFPVVPIQEGWRRFLTVFH